MTKKKQWVSEPEMSDEKVQASTGKGWDEWRAIIDESPVRNDGHKAIAAWLVETQGVGGWWAQAVTVGYERIAGMRLPHQLADGSFALSVSRTLELNASSLKERLLDPAARSGLFPGRETELRSRPSSKNVRLHMGEGAAEFALEELADGRTRVFIQHTKLESPEAVETWRDWWGSWLEGLAN